MSRVFANGPGHQSSILDRVIPKTQKMLFDAALHFKVGLKIKLNNPVKGVEPSPRCSSYWKEGLRVALDYGGQLYPFVLTCLPSRKLSKLDEPETQDTAGEARTNSSMMYSYGPPHMVKQKQDDQLEHTYSSYVRIRDVALKTCQRRWMIGRSGERGSGISVLAARHDDDDDDWTEKHNILKLCSNNCFLTWHIISITI